MTLSSSVTITPRSLALAEAERSNMGQFSMEKPALKGQLSVEINRHASAGPTCGRFVVAEGYRAKDERRAIKVMLRV